MIHTYMYVHMQIAFLPLTFSILNLFTVLSLLSMLLDCLKEAKQQKVDGYTCTCTKDVTIEHNPEHCTKK